MLIKGLKMKKYIILLTFLIIQTITQLSANKIVLKNNEKEFINNNLVTIAMMNKFKPFSYIENESHMGMTKDIIEIISQRTGLKFNIEFDTWTNNIEKFKNRKVDMITGISYKPSRDNFTLFTKPYYKIGVYLFKNKKDAEINTFYDLKNKKVGINKGIFYKELLKNEGISFSEFEDIDDRSHSLAFGEIDCFLGSFTSSLNSISKLSLTNIKPAFEVKQIKKEDLRFGINKSNKILHSIISKALNTITSKELDDLERKWIINIPASDNGRIKLNIEEHKWIKDNKILKVHNEKGWKPFNFFEKEPLGFSIDYMNLLAKKIGVQIEYITGPSWNEFLELIKNNKIDIMLNIVKTPERSQYLKFTKPYKESRDRIYSNNKNKFNSLNELSGKVVAIEKGFSIEGHLKKFYPDIKLKYFKNIEHRLKAVSFGQADATIATPEVAELILKVHLINNVSGTSEIDFKQSSLNNLKLRISTNKDNIILHKLLEKAINKVSYKEKSELENKWFHSDINKIEERISTEEKKYINENILDIATTNTWAPFNFNNNGKLDGIGIDFLKIISEKIGLKYKIHLKENFEEVLTSIKNGNSDITFTTTNTKEREKYALFSTSYEKFPIAIASTNDKNFLPNASLLEGKKVAVGKEYSAYFLLKNKYPHIEFIFTKDTKEALKLVKNNEAYAAVDILPSLQFNINKYYNNKLKIIGTTDTFFELKFMINKEQKILLSPINKAIESINSDEKNFIYRKWFLSQTKGIDPKFFYIILTILAIIISIIIIFNLHILRAKKLIEKEKRKLNGILRNIPVPIVITDKRTSLIVFANEYASIQYSIPLDILIGSNINKIYYNENESTKVSILLTENDQLINFETKYKSSQGTPVDALLSIVSLIYNDQDSRLEVMLNITELKDIQDKLELLNITLEDKIKKEVKKNEEQQLLMFQQSRHAQMGEMIAMIAHQWRQPINTLSLIIQNILFKYKIEKLNENTLTDLVTKGNKQIKNMSQTIEDFTNFFKPEKELKTFIINDELKRIFDILEPILKKQNIDIELNSEKEIQIKGYPNELSQALINIINNAMDALLERDIENKKIRISIKDTKNDVSITIEDNAGGIKKENIGKIFTPYFSTKSEKIGTGLGLYMSKMIIEDHMNGNIKVINTKEGASFKVEFRI